MTWWRARIGLKEAKVRDRRLAVLRQIVRNARSAGKPQKDVIMNSPALGLRVASVIFGLAALGHLILRIILNLHAQLGSWVIGRRWSVVAVVVAVALCVWLWMLAYTAATPKAETPPAKPAV